MPDPIFSEDGYWKFENGQWVASEKQIAALSEGATPHEHSIADNQNVVSSDSGFPTLEKISITEKKLDRVQEKPLYKRKSVIFGTGFIAI